MQYEWSYTEGLKKKTLTLLPVRRFTFQLRWWFSLWPGWERGTSLAWEEPTADQKRRSGSWSPLHRSCSAWGKSWGNRIQRRSLRGRPESLEKTKANKTFSQGVLAWRELDCIISKCRNKWNKNLFSFLFTWNKLQCINNYQNYRIASI